MADERKPSVRRGEMAFMVAIVLGVLLGVFIKRIRIGLMIGIAVGLLIVFTGLLRSTKR